jgi:hypothetical protein
MPVRLQRTRAVGHKTGLNYPKLRGTRLVNKCSKNGNIQIMGDDAKHVLAGRPRECPVTAG